MNLRVLFGIPFICALSNCASLNDPIYYDSEGTNEAAEAQNEFVQYQQAHAINPDQSSAAQVSNSERRINSPFMQPDVLKIPSKDDLKETATSTQGSTGSAGLRVPNR